MTDLKIMMLQHILRKRKKTPAGNSQANITLYTLIDEFGLVKKALTEQFSQMTKEIINSSDENNEENFTIRLLENTEIQINIGHNPEFVKQNIADLYDFFVQVKCPEQKLHQNVLAQIGMFNCVTDCSFGLDSNQERTNYIINALFAAAKDVSGFVLMPDMRLFSGEGKLVFSAEGSSDFEEYTVIETQK